MALIAAHLNAGFTLVLTVEIGIYLLVHLHIPHRPLLPVPNKPDDFCRG